MCVIDYWPSPSCGLLSLLSSSLLTLPCHPLVPHSFPSQSTPAGPASPHSACFIIRVVPDSAHLRDSQNSLWWMCQWAKATVILTFPLIKWNQIYQEYICPPNLHLEALKCTLWTGFVIFITFQPRQRSAFLIMETHKYCTVCSVY